MTRAAVGALTFLLAFALKRGGEDEWVFVAGIIAGGVGGFTATLVAPRLHHILTEDRVLVLALLVPGVVTGIGVLTVGSFSAIVIAFSVGLGAGIASRAIDSMFGRYVSSFARGRVVARSEVRFQAAQVIGAAMTVLFAPGHARRIRCRRRPVDRRRADVRVALEDLGPASRRPAAVGFPSLVGQSRASGGAARRSRAPGSPR